MLARWTADGPPDLERLVDMGARLEPIERVPRRSVPTLRRGAQVLVDLAVGLAPYRYDVEDVLLGARLLSADLIEVMSFSGCPTRGAGKGTRDDWSSWRPPARGTPVLLVSDLGIGGPPMDPNRASVAEWLAFSAVATRAGAPVIALVPFGRERWPVSLMRRMTMVEWDPGTSVAAIRRAVRTS
jgi:hypothetical protein